MNKPRTFDHLHGLRLVIFKKLYIFDSLSLDYFPAALSNEFGASPEKKLVQRHLQNAIKQNEVRRTRHGRSSSYRLTAQGEQLLKDSLAFYRKLI